MSLVPKPELKTLLADATRAYSEQLSQSEPHLEFLEARGVTRDLQLSFGIGAVLDPISSHEDYRGRIAFPYVTPGGVVTIRFRRFPDSDQAKFLELPGEIPRIYNVRALLNNEDEPIYICEGETDTVTAWGCGLQAIGISGAEKWNPVFAKLVRSRDVTVFVDNDDDGSGRRFGNQIYKSLGGCRLIKLPKGHDLNSFVVAEGKEALIDRIENG